MKRSIVTTAVAFFMWIHPGSGEVVQVPAATGQEFSASANDPTGAVEVQATLLLPPTARPARGAIAVVRWGIGPLVYEDPAWRQLAQDLRCGLLHVAVINSGTAAERPIAEQAVRNASIGGAEALGAVLRELARQSGRPELQEAKLLLWGHSAAGSFVTTFAALQPTRTIGVVRYHSHSRGLPLDLKTISRIPALIFAGEKDTTAGVEDSEALWRSGRALQAPWTLAIEPGVPHGSPEALKKANDLALPWVRAVFLQRVIENGRNLRDVDTTSGWRSSNSARQIAPAAAFQGAQAEASWLPDEASANGWLLVSGIQK